MLRQRTEVLFWACAALLLAGCRGGGEPKDGGEDDAGLTVITDTTRTTTQKVDFVLGSALSATSSAGTTYALEIPPQSRWQPSAQVSLTPIDAVRKLPAGVEFLAGVHLEPDGLTLEPPAKLTVTLPAATATDDLFAFGYAGSSDDLHLVPHPDWPASAAQLDLTVGHFSGTGIASGVGTATAAFNPAAASARLEQAMANLLEQARRDGVLPWYDAQRRAQFSALMKQAFGEWVKPTLEEARKRVEASLSQSCTEPRAAALDATVAAVRALSFWVGPLRQWDDEVFPPRHQPPDDWPYAREWSKWSGFYADIGLDAALDSSLEEAADTLNEVFLKGMQEEACMKLEVCQRYECLEQALLWAATLNVFAGSLTPKAVINELDINTYCDGITHTYTDNILMLPAELRIDRHQTGEFEALALGGEGAPLDVQPQFFWESTDRAVATVSLGTVTGNSPGKATIVVVEGAGCRSTTGTVYVYLPPFSIQGTANVSCEWTRRCGCGNRGTPPSCTDENLSRQGSITLRLFMDHKRLLHWAAESTSITSSICANGEDAHQTPDSARWESSEAAWRDNHTVIFDWEFGGRGSTHFSWGESRTTDNTYYPLRFRVDLHPPPTADIVIPQEPLCGSEATLSLH